MNEIDESNRSLSGLPDLSAQTIMNEEHEVGETVMQNTNSIVGEVNQETRQKNTSFQLFLLAVTCMFYLILMKNRVMKLHLQ